MRRVLVALGLTVSVVLAGCGSAFPTTTAPPAYAPSPTQNTARTSPTKTVPSASWPAFTPQPTAVSSTVRPASPTGINVSLLAIAEIGKNLPRYDRDQWRHWVDADRDCQNTRHEVLIEESSIPVRFRDGRNCTVDSGLWVAPFTGATVNKASELDVDHMVPLANAHRSGGWAWDGEKKEAYANDLSFDGHLIAATASANRSKSDRGPEHWRPSDTSYWCDYAVIWITIKAKWGLTATAAEWESLEAMLGTCSSDVTIQG